MCIAYLFILLLSCGSPLSSFSNLLLIPTSSSNGFISFNHMSKELVDGSNRKLVPFTFLPVLLRRKKMSLADIAVRWVPKRFTIVFILFVMFFYRVSLFAAGYVIFIISTLCQRLRQLLGALVLRFVWAGTLLFPPLTLSRRTIANSM